MDNQQTFETQFFLNPNTGNWQTIQERMQHYRVPGASIAYVGGNQVLWRGAYGVREVDTVEKVTPDTPFQAASLSKPHTSIGVQRLFASLQLDLDSSVIAHTSCPIPCRSCAKVDWAPLITVKETLQHKAGFIGRGNTYPTDQCADFNGNGGGFSGYENVPDVVLPTLEEILRGIAPANSPAIELTTQPGTEHYSGAGYVVMMRMIQDMTGQPFHQWMQDNVLAPLGMAGSTYRLGPPDFLPPAAAGHQQDGQPIKGLRNRYPESSAAGLYTTAGDLCQTIIMLNNQGSIDGQQILTPSQVTAMINQQIGIFSVVQTDPDFRLYNHTGSNYGFASFMQGYPDIGAGMAILVNRDDGDHYPTAEGFYYEAMHALIRVYDLPKAKTKPKPGI